MDESIVIINNPGNSTSFNEQKEKQVKLLYSRSSVYLQLLNEPKVFGSLSLVEKTTSDYLIVWTPDTVSLFNEMEPFINIDDDLEEIEMSQIITPESKEHKIYAPVDTIHSILVTPFSSTQPYNNITIHLKNGTTCGPFWFHNNQEENEKSSLQTCTDSSDFIEKLGRFVNIKKSSDAENLYIIVTKSPKKETHFIPTNQDSIFTALKEARWTLLEKLSRVTTFSRNTASNILQKSPMSKPDIYDNETVRRTMMEYDSASIFLAKWAASLSAQSENYMPFDRKYQHVGIWGHDDSKEYTVLNTSEIVNSVNDFSISTHTRVKPITKAEWDSYFGKHGKLTVEESIIRKNIFYGGLEPDIRKEVWLFLTGVYPWNSTAKERDMIKMDNRKLYEDMKNKWFNDISYKESDAFEDLKHKIDKDVHRTDRTVDLYADDSIPNPSRYMQVGTNKNLETLKDILCTYHIFDKELDYVQGMSDLLSPLYAVFREEDVTFWAFVGFMKRMKSNFSADQSEMHQQLLTMNLLLQFMDPALFKHLCHSDSNNLFFCFRWLLVWFKREFNWEDTLTLWEVLWTDYLTDKFYYFVALSILDQHRNFIMDYLKNFDEVLKYINDLSMTINLEETLQRAEILYYQFKQRIEAVDNKKQELNKLLYSNSTPTEAESIKNDLKKLPTINELLRELVSSSFIDTNAFIDTNVIE